MVKQTSFNAMIRDRVIRIESKLSRHVEEQNKVNEEQAAVNKRVLHLCDTMEGMAEEWHQFKREWDEEGEHDGPDVSAHSINLTPVSTGTEE